MAILQLVRLSNVRVVEREWALVTAGCGIFRSHCETFHPAQRGTGSPTALSREISSTTVGAFSALRCLDRGQRRRALTDLGREDSPQAAKLSGSRAPRTLSDVTRRRGPGST